MAVVEAFSLFTDFDIDLFKAGKHFKLYEKFGVHFTNHNGQEGAYFSVYAPAAKNVAVIGNFNHWDGGSHELHVRWDTSGIWEGFIPDFPKGELYKFRIWSDDLDHHIDKADPFARYAELKPKTSSISWTLEYQWKDDQWMKDRPIRNALNQPHSVYEVHLGSWKKNIEENRSLTYEEHAIDLVSYVKNMGYTHVEFMPVMEFPYDPSWGYQVTGFFAPTSRYGNPQQFMALIDAFHQQEIGVILDWVPAHFPSDEHGLARFDGTCVYEHPDPNKGYHPDWKSCIFNYERNEVRSFLISSAFFWLELFHIDGLRVDAVASMLYLDYSRELGAWEPNEFGGNENLSAISFLQELNAAVYGAFPGIQMIAEESTAFGGVSRPVDLGGLGFGMKWMMGWMHDTLNYFKNEPVYRKYHQESLTFSLVYAFSENFMLPLSHDEVVHGKGSIINRMPGDEWQRFANLRSMYAYMYAHPGTKLNFMGNEIGQYEEWDFDGSLSWHILEYDPHIGLQKCIQDLNQIYQSEPAFYEYGFDQRGFEWIDYADHENSVISFLRKGSKSEDTILTVMNFTPEPRHNYHLGICNSKHWSLLFNSDDKKYWGSDFKTEPDLAVSQKEEHGRTQSLVLNLPPLSVVMYKINNN